MQGWHRRCLFGRHGRTVVASLCGYEVVALMTPLPTISEIVRRRRPLGWMLLAMLAQHWFLEAVATDT